MLGWTFLLASGVGLAFSIAGVVRLRRGLGVLAVPWFGAGLMGGELALYHVAWQALATLGFVWAGALESTPGVIGGLLTVVSWIALGIAHGQSLAAQPSVRLAVREGWPDLELPRSSFRARELANPLRRRWPGVERIPDLAYAEGQPRDPGDRNRLDVYRSMSPGERRPVLVQIHGGAWVVGHKAQQALPLMNHMAAKGWVVVAPNYRLSPRATWPDHIVDVKRAIAWTRAHVAEYGGDPDFVCITGGSAGGHLSALAALTANDPAFQPGFEDVDTTLAAAVPYYGVFDFLDRNPRRLGRAALGPFLESRVLKCSRQSERRLWEAASPLDRVHSDAPPFLVIQGSHDSLVLAEECQTFVDALRRESKSRVIHLELPGAQHAFDVFNTLRTAHTTRVVASFLERVHADTRAVA